MKSGFSLHIGLAQINPTVGDFSGTQKKVAGYIEKAESEQMDLVIFPELSVSGYPVWDLANKKSFVESGINSLRHIVNATRQRRVTAIVGFVDHGSKHSGKNRNGAAVIQNGKIILTQHKTLLPTYDVFLEQIFFEPADQYRLFSINGFKIGTSICEDIWDDGYKLKPSRLLKQKGAQVLINISASPYHRKVAHVRDELIRRRAKENKLWLVYVNQVGGQDDLVFDGRSLVADPTGKIVFRAAPFQETLGSFRIAKSGAAARGASLGEIDEIREIYQALVLGIQDYVSKNRFKKVVVGLSGGIDSAMVVTLACDALGPEAVIAVTMPSQYSSTGSYQDSEELAKSLGIEFRKIPIQPLFETFLKEAVERKRSMGKQREFKAVSLANENLQARLRGLELMYISNDENALLLSTGNKSELAMGYCTLYGDMCGGLAVLGDVYKTDVYRIARYRNEISPVIPEAILTKAPSAELRPNQKDRDSLPPYDVLDQILELYIEKNMHEKDILQKLKAEGIADDVIIDTIRKVDHNEYKRRQTPPIIRVTQKAWFGRRMPITNQFRVSQ